MRSLSHPIHADGPAAAVVPSGPTRPGDVWLVSRSRIRLYESPRAILRATTLDEVRSCIEAARKAVDSGLYVAGLIAYEAAPAFDSAFSVHAGSEVPLVWFGVYDEYQYARFPELTDDTAVRSDWRPLRDRESYLRNVGRIRDYIAAGDTYQVNFTFPLMTEFQGDARRWFQTLSRAQRCDYCAFLDIGRFKVLSLSPECFFRLDGDRLETRPMKGTGRRGRSSRDDLEQRRQLMESAKDRAENVMIVDLLRNDMGRISVPGSVRVESLFDVERYETLWQMTSTISSETHADVPEILEALFPSGSVTGAPKIRTMQIIRELEEAPRGVYCGAIGWWDPGRLAEFSVAIRTLTLDSESGRAIYPVGAAITWDSSPAGEYDECLLKASVLHYSSREFELLETIRRDGAWFLLDEHLRRLEASAAYFGFAYDDRAVRSALDEAVSGLEQPARVRLLLCADGSTRCETTPLPPSGPVRVRFAGRPVDSSNVTLYHKTTDRSVYDTARGEQTDCDDVILWNEEGYVTESTFANVVADIGGRRLTPPVKCGLLPGVMRAHLLEQGHIEEGMLTKADLARADALWLINSVRGWVAARLLVN